MADCAALLEVIAGHDPKDSTSIDRKDLEFSSEMTDIIAAGAGASTKLVYHAENRVERVENCKSVDDYINRFDEMLDRKRKAF